jgi:hypothetical protein
MGSYLAFAFLLSVLLRVPDSDNLYIPPDQVRTVFEIIESKYTQYMNHVCGSDHAIAISCVRWAGSADATTLGKLSLSSQNGFPGAHDGHTRYG